MENDHLQRNGKERDYVQMNRKRNDLEEGVIYTKEIKEKKERRVKKYLPRLIDDLPENLCMFYLAFGGVQRIDHTIELSPRAHYFIKLSKNELIRILRRRTSS